MRLRSFNICSTMLKMLYESVLLKRYLSVCCWHLSTWAAPSTTVQLHDKIEKFMQVWKSLCSDYRCEWRQILVWSVSKSTHCFSFLESRTFSILAARKLIWNSSSNFTGQRLETCSALASLFILKELQNPSPVQVAWVLTSLKYLAEKSFI